MNIESIRNGLEYHSKSEKESVISHIGDLFESYVTIDFFPELVELLIKSAIDEVNEEIKLQFLDVISRASNHRNINDINFDMIEDNLTSMSVECLEKALEILSFSHNIKYLETIKKYLLHENKKIAYVASIALVEIMG